MSMVRFGHVALMLALAAVAPACSAVTAGDSAASDADLSLPQLAAKDVDVKGAVDFGETANGMISKTDKPVWAASFRGTKGDKISGEVFATGKGTAYLFKKVAGGKYAIIRQQKIAGGANGTAKLEVTLTTSGDFFLGFGADFPAGNSTAIETVMVTLGGAPANADAAWLQALKTKYEEDSSTGTTELGPVDESKLPAAAKTLMRKWTREFSDYPPEASEWDFQGKKVYVVEDDNDGGMYISFFNEAGDEIASGSAGESEDFRWD